MLDYSIKVKENLELIMPVEENVNYGELEKTIKLYQGFRKIRYCFFHS